MGTYRNAHLIYNPFAGTLKRNPKTLEHSIEKLTAQGHTIRRDPTEGPRTASAMARRAIESGADLVVAAGGDGTINEVLNGMVHSDVPLAILPGGTANVLAVELGVSTRMTRAAGEFADLVPTRIALGLLEFPRGEARHFALMAGVGLDAMIVYNISAALKARLGKVAYWVAGFGQLGRRLPEFPVCATGRQWKASFALASRVRNYGGDLNICRNASLLGDDFEMVVFEGRHTIPYLKYFTGVLLDRLHGMRGVSVVRAAQVEFPPSDDPRVYIQVDGEYAGHAPARISIVPDAVTLMVPKQFLKRHG